MYCSLLREVKVMGIKVKRKEKIRDVYLQFKRSDLTMSYTHCMREIERIERMICEDVTKE